MQTEGQIASPTRIGREDQLQFLRFWAFFNVFVCDGEQWLFFKYPTSHCSTAAVSFFFFFPSAGSAMSLALIVSSERTKQLFSRLPAESFSVSSTRVSSPANTSLSVC